MVSIFKLYTIVKVISIYSFGAVEKRKDDFKIFEESFSNLLIGST